MVRSQPHKPAGAPTGGQFATALRPAPDYQLGTDDLSAGTDLMDGVNSQSATMGGARVEPDVLVLEGSARRVAYLRDGLFHDPDDGRPASVWYRTDGTVCCEIHWANNLRNDPAGGAPAVVHYRGDGTVSLEEHCRDGELNDPADGGPAVVHYRTDGSVSSKQHYRYGLPHDPPDGGPAVVHYRTDGTVQSFGHWLDGRPIS